MDARRVGLQWNSGVDLSPSLAEAMMEHGKSVLQICGNCELAVPVSGGRDSGLVCLMCLASGVPPTNMHFLHDVDTASTEEQTALETMERKYGVAIERFHSWSKQAPAVVNLRTWEDSEQVFTRRHDYIEYLVKKHNWIRVLSSNLSELGARLFTRGQFSNEEHVLEPIQPFFATEVRQLLQWLEVPTIMYEQRPYTSETGVFKEDVLNASFDVADSALWLKWHGMSPIQIATALNIRNEWASEFFAKRVSAQKEYTRPTMEEVWKDPCALGSMSSALTELLYRARWQRLRRAGAKIPAFLPSVPSIELFYTNL